MEISLGSLGVAVILVLVGFWPFCLGAAAYAVLLFLA